MDGVSEHVDLLGYPVRDAVTGFKGVVTSVGFDLYGCVQAIVQPVANDKGELSESKWFDMNRLTKTSESRVMPLPNFAATMAPVIERNGVDKGPAEKPASSRF